MMLNQPYRGGWSTSLIPLTQRLSSSGSTCPDTPRNNA
jgi:hypothetical protein